MDNRWPWYRDAEVQKAVRQFLLALVLLGLALLGYEVQVTRTPQPAAPIEAPGAVPDHGIQSLQPPQGACP